MSTEEQPTVTFTLYLFDKDNDYIYYRKPNLSLVEVIHALDDWTSKKRTNDGICLFDDNEIPSWISDFHEVKDV